MRGYPGSKGGMGVAAQIISLMPPHNLYVEPFFGGGAVLYAKRPAAFSIAADRDADVIRYAARAPLPDTQYLVADAFKLLPSLDLSSGPALVYLDPPYHPATRSKRAVYKFELSHAQHANLLHLVRSLPCQVMLSGYRCALYDAALDGWHRHDFRAGTRGGVRIESVWCNFTPGDRLHDVRYVGDGYRERERIKRKRTRWARRFRLMPPAERAVIREALIEADAAGDAR